MSKELVAFSIPMSGFPSKRPGAYAMPGPPPDMQGRIRTPPALRGVALEATLYEEESPAGTLPATPAPTSAQEARGRGARCSYVDRLVDQLARGLRLRRPRS